MVRKGSCLSILNLYCLYELMFHVYFVLFKREIYFLQHFLVFFSAIPQLFLRQPFAYTLTLLSVRMHAAEEIVHTEISHQHTEERQHHIQMVSTRLHRPEKD